MKPPFDPILIHITPTFGIHWYGVLIVLGVIMGALYAAWRAKRDGGESRARLGYAILAVLLAIVGARLYHVFSEPEGGMVGWSYYRQHPIEILYIWQGGLGIYGAVVGGVLGVARSTAGAPSSIRCNGLTMVRPAWRLGRRLAAGETS